ncbi:flagella synthesis protein FlgN [Chitinimonas koreensis]|uniref:flagella synthesis protein FlgN n=1 Tax=Chitinimonas koreensis TaxID=356302 RepID=UPI00042728E8|nr:flagellar protein FlgN [Chitinimonas koreensis]QNM95613.1 flagellar protein FlgN [Chitinimonas koreensis]
MPPLPLLVVLQNELAELQAFVALLEREQRALVANTLADLVEFAKEKAARAQTLEALAKERKRLFEVNGVELSPDPPHPLTGARQLPAEHLPTLAALWQELIQSARQASALNLTNGRLIDTRQQQNQQLMSMLQATHTTSLSYDAYGQPRMSRPGSSLGKA